MQILVKNFENISVKLWLSTFQDHGELLLGTNKLLTFYMFYLNSCNFELLLALQYLTNELGIEFYNLTLVFRVLTFEC